MGALGKLLRDLNSRPADAVTGSKIEHHEIDIGASELIATTERALREAPLRFLTAFAAQERGSGAFLVRYTYAHRSARACVSLVTRVDAKTPLPSVTLIVPAANWPEREMMELLGVPIDGHPDPRSLIQHRGWPLEGPPLAREFPTDGVRRRLEKDPDYGFLKVEGDGVCEVPVGPIHAGIIEPGHFRFSIAGEPVLHLEIRLGYQHKGIEKMHEGRTPEQGLILAERTSGDNSVAHAAAYLQAVESLAGIELSPRAAEFRTMYLEIERVTHHLGDIGGVLLDIAYNFGASQLAILREDLFRLNARLTGSRLLFGALAIGGVAHALSDSSRADVLRTLDEVEREFRRAMRVSLTSSSVVDRLDGTGTLTREHAEALSVVGPAARASGLAVDARRDLPHASYATLSVPLLAESRGDVMARVRVKETEVHASIAMIRTLLARESDGPMRHTNEYRCRTGELAFGAAEAHRGEVLYAIIMGEGNRVERCHVRDPSSVNWRAIESAVPNGNIIADFPVVNKSFNLSYSGNDR